MNFRYMDSPLGKLLLAGDDGGLRHILLPEDGIAAPADPDWTESGDHTDRAAQQLAAYFAGELQEFDLALVPSGTPFQLAVWRALRDIPYGTTVSYGEVARAIGRPKACRAVGLANGRNPIPIVIPCHRVIGASGSLVGYGGGLAAKRTLLEIERT